MTCLPRMFFDLAPQTALPSLLPVGLEAALEPAPGDALGRQQIADIAAGHGDEARLRIGAVVELRIGIGDHGALHDDDIAIQLHILGRGAMGIAGDEVDGAGGRRAEIRAEGIVVEGEMLGVVPERRHRIAVEIAHHRLGVAALLVGIGRGEFDELVHQPAVEGLLLRRVVVIHVAGRRLLRRQPDGIGRVGIVGQQRLGQAVHGRRPGRGVEGRLSRKVHGLGVGGEVMVEGDVLLEQHDHMLDRRPGRLRAAAGVPAKPARRARPRYERGGRLTGGSIIPVAPGGGRIADSAS